MSEKDEPQLAEWKQVAVILAAAVNLGLAYYDFLPMGESFAIGSSFGRAILTPFLVIALFQIGKRFRNRNSRYTIFLVMSALVALASFGRIVNTSMSAEFTPEQIVTGSLPNLNQGLPETLDNGMRIELYEADGPKIVGNFTIVDPTRWDTNGAFWSVYIAGLEALPCVNDSYRELLEYGVVFEFRIRDSEGGLVETLQTKLEDCQ